MNDHQDRRDPAIDRARVKPRHVASIWNGLLLMAPALVAAYLLTPQWPVWNLQGAALVTVTACYLVGVTLLLAWLPPHCRGQTFLGLLAFVALAMTGLIGAAYSLRYAQLAALAAASLTGCWLIALTRPVHATTGTPLTSLYVIVVCGLAFVAAVEADPPLTGLLATAAAPLALWLCAIGPLSRLTGRQRIAAQCGAVVVALGGGVAWTLLR